MEFQNFYVYVSNKSVMKFQNNNVYYLFNTGNNYQRVFFSNRNKDYFKRKIQKFIAPFAEVLHVLLSDNQFHILIKTKKDVPINLLNKNIGIMLSSYVQGVNKEQNRVGSLFRQGTKAFSEVAEFPWHIRKKLEKLRNFHSPSRIVNFQKSCKQFLTAILREKLNPRILNKLNLQEALNHPKLSVGKFKRLNSS